MSLQDILSMEIKRDAPNSGSTYASAVYREAPQMRETLLGPGTARLYGSAGKAPLDVLERLAHLHSTEILPKSLKSEVDAYVKSKPPQLTNPRATGLEDLLSSDSCTCAHEAMTMPDVERLQRTSRILAAMYSRYKYQRREGFRDQSEEMIRECAYDGNERDVACRKCTNIAKGDELLHRVDNFLGFLDTI